MPDQGWTIIDRSAGVLTHEYAFAPKAHANAFTARLADGRLFVVSPPRGMSDEGHAALAEFGEVGAVVANNGFHHLGLRPWRDRYPGARFFAPTDAIPRIRKRNLDAPELEPLRALVPLLGPGAGVHEVADTKCGEMWCWADVAGGSAWYLSDILANMPGLPGNFALKWLFKLTGSAPGYRVFNLALKFTVKDKRAVLRALAAAMKERPPTVVVPAHGPVLRGDGLAAETQELLAAAS
ncbi:MAG: hypothetical protein R3B09_26460 [Nannocystaceae bacterium]